MSRPKARAAGGIVHELPIVAGGGPTIAKSRTSRWRAAVLIGVHLIMLAHVTHYLVAGRTLSPVEPSESMYTLELGQVNAGFVFFGLAIASTLLFGRFFCGWGCHVVALQDLCGWIMRKLGVKPQPFRSRLLLFAPLALALYMFAWPTFRRVVLGEGPPFPGFSNHLVTTGFWQTFPGPVFAVLTFLCCGFLAVYMLGSKGFCTYGCPYGAFFAAADRLSPTRIVVNDHCEQSGHCTATCTSNVRVHEEVRLYGRVVDPGSMKCMDCVSVCPNDALSLGFTAPAVLSRAPAAARAKVPGLALGEELLVGGTCLVATLAFRGLYDGPPLLMAVALGGVTGFACLQLWRLARRPTVRLQSLTLKAGGALSRSGRAFVVVGVGWLAFTGHSAFVQWHRAWGRHHLQGSVDVGRAQALAGAFDPQRTSPRHQRSVERGLRHLALADRWGLVELSEIDLGLAWFHLLRKDPAAAEERIRAALALAPDDPALHENLIEFLAVRGRIADAGEAIEQKLRHVAPSASDHLRLGEIDVHAERPAAAAEHFAAAVALAPESLPARFDLGGLLRRLGRPGDALPHLREAARIAPGDADTHLELGLALAAIGDDAGALAALRRAADLGSEAAREALRRREFTTVHPPTDASAR